MATTILLDPGHGGPDPGAIGPGGTKEADINLRIALKVDQYLGRSRFCRSIVLQEPPNTRWSPSDIAKRANIDEEVLALVSIHLNAAGPDQAPLTKGREVYWQRDNAESASLARAIDRALKVTTGLAGRCVVRVNSTGDADYYGVLRLCNKTAVLVELDYISNPEEEEKIATDWWQEKAAIGLAQGIVEWTKGG